MGTGTRCLVERQWLVWTIIKIIARFVRGVLFWSDGWSRSVSWSCLSVHLVFCVSICIFGVGFPHLAFRIVVILILTYGFVQGDSAILGPPLANGSTSPISALERGNSYGNNPSLSSSTSYKGPSTNHDVGVGSNLGAGASGSLINGNGTGTSGKDWVSLVPREVLSNLPESEVQRQTIIHTLISREEQYLADLDMIEAVYIKPLRDARPSIVRARTSTGNVSAKANAILGRSNSNGINGISYAGINGRRSGGGVFPSSVSQDDHFSPNDRLSIEGEGLGENADVNATHTFISVVFGNILDVRETNRRLLEILYIRQREEGIVVRRVGDIFLHAATELFRVVYPIYLSGWWEAERVLREEMEYTSQHQLVGGEGDVSFKSWADVSHLLFI